MFENKEEIKTEISTDCSYYKNVMTEEIINDGVNVAGCQYYEEGNCCNEDVLTWSCKNTNCMYKQLKRLKQENNSLQAQLNNITIQSNNAITALEQENKILKSNTNVLNDYITKNEQLKTNIDHLVKINESLKQENKELRKDVQLFKCLDTFGENECHCACRCLGNEFCEDADKKIDTYRSALEEISLIIDELKQQYDYMSDYSEIKEIENKINEVLND